MRGLEAKRLELASEAATAKHKADQAGEVRRSSQPLSRRQPMHMTHSRIGGSLANLGG